MAKIKKIKNIDVACECTLSHNNWVWLTKAFNFSTNHRKKQVTVRHSITSNEGNSLSLLNWKNSFSTFFIVQLKALKPNGRFLLKHFWGKIWNKFAISILLHDLSSEYLLNCNSMSFLQRIWAINWSIYRFCSTNMPGWGLKPSRVPW